MKLPWRSKKTKPVIGVPTVRRTGNTSVRNYNAVSNLARYGDFVGTSGSADYELANGLAKLRNKARSLYRNSSAQRRYVQLLRVNVIGEKGTRLQSKVRMSDGSLDRNVNTALSSEWEAWWRRPTTCGRLSGRALLNQAMASYGNDGEVIWEIVMDRRYNSGVAINPIEADLLDETLITTNASNGNEIRLGVEVDTHDRPVAYWFLTMHPGGLATGSTNPRERHRRVPAERVLHMFDSYRAGQTRGEPPASPVINPIKMLDGYREAETMGRRLRAAIMGFFTRDHQTTKDVSELADKVSDDGEDFEMFAEPGLLKSLPKGMDFKAFDPGGAQGDYHQFEGQMRKDQGMGLGISAFSHGMETSGVSYSTGRSVLTEDRDFYRMLQSMMIEGLMEPLFRAWLPIRAVDVECEIPPRKINKVLASFRFYARGWDWIDPAKEVSANTEALRTKQTTLTRIAAQRGLTLDELLDEIEEEQQHAAERGLTLDYDSVKTEQVTEEVEDDEPDDE